MSKNLAHPPKTVWPAIGWYLFFLAIPIGIILFYSFLKKGLYGGIEYEWNIDNYLRAFQPIYLGIVWESFKLAFVTALLCLLIGYPVAYVMATIKNPYRGLLMVLLIIPFWTNLVVRTYAIKLLLGDHGPLNHLLIQWGWITEPLPFSNSYGAVLFGMVTNYLPFMVLPLYVTLEKFDFSLLEAARDLGATSRQLLTRILLPLTQRGMVTGFLLVFTPALGEFLIPDLLGGARTMLVGNLIIDQFLKMRDWPFGSAISILLMIVVVMSLLITLKLWNENRERRQQQSSL